jgi:hypothetical protein
MGWTGLRPVQPVFLLRLLRAQFSAGLPVSARSSHAFCVTSDDYDRFAAVRLVIPGSLDLL